MDRRVGQKRAQMKESDDRRRDREIADQHEDDPGTPPVGLEEPNPYQQHRVAVHDPQQLGAGRRLNRPYEQFARHARCEREDQERRHPVREQDQVDEENRKEGAARQPPRDQGLDPIPQPPRHPPAIMAERRIP